MCRPWRDLKLPAELALEFCDTVPCFLKEVLATFEAVGSFDHRLWRFSELFVVRIRILITKHQQKCAAEALLQRLFGYRRPAKSLGIVDVKPRRRLQSRIGRHRLRVASIWQEQHEMLNDLPAF